MADKAGVTVFFRDQLDDHLADEALQALQDKEDRSLKKGVDPFQRAIQVDRATSCALIAEVFFAYPDRLRLALSAIRIYDSWMSLAAERDLALDAPFPPEVVFTRTTAICHLACIMEGVCAPLEQLVCVARGNMGRHCDEVSQQDIADEAWALVSISNSAPSAASWISIFNARLDMATHTMLAGQLKQLEHLACQIACQFALLVPASPDQLPCKTALGSFMLALLMMRIVQLDALQPRLPRNEGWNWMLTVLQAMQHQEDGFSSPPSLDPQILVAVIECTTKKTLEEICADAIAVAVVCFD